MAASSGSGAPDERRERQPQDRRHLEKSGWLNRAAELIGSIRLGKWDWADHYARVHACALPCVCAKERRSRSIHIQTTIILNSI